MKTMSLKEPKKSIPDQVFESLIDAIRQDEIKPGEKLPSEHELCEMFGVSRPSVKTAIDRLKLLGIIEAKVGDGTYVREYTVSDFLNLYSNFFISNTKGNQALDLLRSIVTESYWILKRPVEPSVIEKMTFLRKKIISQIQHKNETKTVQLIFDFSSIISTVSENTYFQQLLELLAGILKISDIHFLVETDLFIHHYDIILNGLKDSTAVEAGVLSLRSLFNSLTVDQ